MVEIIRHTGVGASSFSNLIKLYEGFYRGYSKFISDIIIFGQYNTSEAQLFLDSLPKSFRNFFDDLYTHANSAELLSKICLIFGGDESLFKNKDAFILFISKIISGVYWVDLDEIIQKIFPKSYNSKIIKRLYVEDLGEKTSRISFDGYEGAEIAKFGNLYSSDLFKATYLEERL